MTSGRWITAALATGWLAVGTGCVSMDEYRKLQLAQNKLAAEKIEIEKELYDARSMNGNLQTQLAASRDRTRSKEQISANLQSENQQLQAAIASAQKTVETLAAHDFTNDPIIIEAKLPAELDSALKGFAERFPGKVSYDAERGIVKWQSDLLFALGSDVVKPPAQDALQGFADVMASPAASGFEIAVVGHTDNRPISRAETKSAHPTNWHLSVHRAISVAKALQGSGIDPVRMGVTGYGEFRPADSNDTAEGRRQNRRVEIYIVPAGTLGDAPAMAASEPAPALPTTQISRLDDGVK